MSNAIHRPKVCERLSEFRSSRNVRLQKWHVYKALEQTCPQVSSSCQQQPHTVESKSIEMQLETSVAMQNISGNWKSLKKINAET